MNEHRPENPPANEAEPTAEALTESLTEFLADLLDVQDQLLAMLSEKRAAMLAGNLDALAEFRSREEDLGRRLEDCHRRRKQLLAAAGDSGLPAANLKQLAARLEGTASEPPPLPFSTPFSTAAEKLALLRHESLTNWVLAQRSLLHVSQMMEIIATGGRPQPTYDKDSPYSARGALVDGAA